MCPHCGQQFIRPGAQAAPSPATAAPAPPRRAAAAAPAPAPAAAPARRTGAGSAASAEPEPGFASRYLEERQSKSSAGLIWIILGILGAVVVVVALVIFVIKNKSDEDRHLLENELKKAALAYAARNQPEAAAVLNLKPGKSANLNPGDVKFDGEVAYVYFNANKQRIYIRFERTGDEWVQSGGFQRD